MKTIIRKSTKAILSSVKVYFFTNFENFSLIKIPINTGKVINKNVLSEKLNNFKSKLSSYKKLEKKFKYKGCH